MADGGSLSVATWYDSSWIGGTASGEYLIQICAQNRTLHANHAALCSIDPSFGRWKLQIAGIWISDVCCSCDLDLDSMTLIRTWPVFSRDVRMYEKCSSYVEAFESSRLTDIHTYIQTDRHTVYRQTWPKLYTTPLRGWSVNLQIVNRHEIRGWWWWWWWWSRNLNYVMHQLLLGYCPYLQHTVYERTRRLTNTIVLYGLINIPVDLALYFVIDVHGFARV